jgi:hypothetical protein
MADKIKIRRGEFPDLPTLNSGEFGWATDVKSLYLGSPTGNALINVVKEHSDGYSIDGYLLPTTDNIHGLGNPSLRWRNVTVGPSSLHLVSRAAETGGTAYNYTLGIDNAGNFIVNADGYVAFSVTPTGSSTLSNNKVLVLDGTEASPSYSFSTNPTTGLYLSAAGELSISSSAAQKLSVGSNGITIWSGGSDESEFMLLEHDGTDGYIHSAQGVINLGTKASTNHGLTTGGVLVGGALEVDGQAYFDSTTAFSAGTSFASQMSLGANVELIAGATGAGFILNNTTQTPNTSTLQTSPLSNSFIMAEYADKTADFNFPLQTNPTFVVQSADATSNNQRIYFAHNQTDGYIATDFGGMQIATNSAFVTLSDSSGAGAKIDVSEDNRFKIYSEDGTDDMAVYCSQVVASSALTAASLLYTRANTNQTVPAGSFETRNCKYAYLSTYENRNVDFNFVDQTNPTLVIQSVDGTSPGQRIYFAHNQTDGYIATDAGGLSLDPFSEQILIPDGTAAAPAFTFASDKDTGLCLAAGGNMGYTSSGVLRWAFSGSTFLSQNSSSINMQTGRIYSSSTALNLGASASTSHSLVTGDVLVGGKLEVDGYSYFDAPVSVSHTQVSAETYMNGSISIVGVDTTSAVTVWLPDASDFEAGTIFYVKDETGNAGVQNITVGPAEVGQLIDGNATTTISTNYGSITVYTDGSNYFIV